MATVKEDCRALSESSRLEGALGTPYTQRADLVQRALCQMLPFDSGRCGVGVESTGSRQGRI